MDEFKIQNTKKKVKDWIFSLPKNPQLRTTNYELRTKHGFTLIEIIVSVAIFSVVMLVAVGALLSLLAAYQRAQTFESVMNNLNIAMENMVKDIRVGSHYHAGSGSIETPLDGTSSTFAFEPSGGNTGDQNDQVVLSLSDGRIMRSDTGGGNSFAITSEEVEIDTLAFRVYDSGASDGAQARVTIIIRGTAGTDPDTQTDFNLEATATQRLLDS